MAIRLSCSQCPAGSYVRNNKGPGDYKCEHCDHRVDYLDFLNHLDDGEVIGYDDDGYVTVETIEEINGHESHIMPNGSEHDASDCPPECTITLDIARILVKLDLGELKIIRES